MNRNDLSRWVLRYLKGTWICESCGKEVYLPARECPDCHSTNLSAPPLSFLGDWWVIRTFIALLAILLVIFMALGFITSVIVPGVMAIGVWIYAAFLRCVEIALILFILGVFLGLFIPKPFKDLFWALVARVTTAIKPKKKSSKSKKKEDDDDD